MSVRLAGDQHSIACAARSFFHPDSDQIEGAVAGEDGDDDDDD